MSENYYMVSHSNECHLALHTSKSAWPYVNYLPVVKPLHLINCTVNNIVAVVTPTLHQASQGLHTRKVGSESHCVFDVGGCVLLCTQLQFGHFFPPCSIRGQKDQQQLFGSKLPNQS